MENHVRSTPEVDKHSSTTFKAKSIWIPQNICKKQNETMFIVN